jgi:clathrin heavy chain
VIQCFAETGQYGKIILYAKKVGYQPDYVFLLQTIMRLDPEKGTEFATLVANDPEIRVDLEQVRLYSIIYSYCWAFIDK